MIQKLNVGCGEDIKKGYINLDILKLPGVDVVCDLEKPLPFEDNFFDEVFIQDVLEHIDYVPLMPELYRVMKLGGRLKIRMPHFSSHYNHIDPTHTNLFSFETMSFFTKDCRWNEFYFKSKHKFSKLISSRLDFDKVGWLWFNRIIEPLVNFNEKTKRVYEGTFLRNLFPCSNIYVEIER